MAAANKMDRAYYSASISDFILDDQTRILGELVAHHPFALDDLQRNAWIDQITILKEHLKALETGYILLEYAIPRMGKRVDGVVLTSGIVIILEFKVGETHYSQHAIDQALDYALDLKNFHEQSFSKSIVPIVVATEATNAENHLIAFDDQIFEPIKANKTNLGLLIKWISSKHKDADFPPIQWRDSLYKPTPTIIEAAQALYRGHDVKEISRSDASAINLSKTAEAIAEIITNVKNPKALHRKAICFVTGVPGAGKTLAGLNIANERLQTNQDEHAVFLSGNGPLVNVLQEALARSTTGNNGRMTGGSTKKASLSKAKAFIQNIHFFRDDALSTKQPPLEKVVIFDEAQRAWTLEQTVSFMKRKRNEPNFSMSEPDFLISIMDRHPDWAVIICLVGGGQEINTGEAGLMEWFEALRTHYPSWLVCYSPNITDDEYTRGVNIENYFSTNRINVDPRLHLAVSIRSYRAENVSNFIKAILDNDRNQAETLYPTFSQRYPILLTRDVEKAKTWLRSIARGTERYGILASSGGIRLRPIGINVQAEIDVINWFLNGKHDIRSSYYLEEVATEFDVQGLELDWTCVAWDADLRYANGDWEYKSFRGASWQNIKDDLRKRYLRNAYRVLLTRARQGMVIVVPHGDKTDHTRPPTFYDGTYNYLREIGLEIL